MSQPERDYQTEVDGFLRSLSSADSAPESAYALAVVLNRAAALLQQVARAEATARKGEPEWGRWMALQNAARNVVLQASTCRDLAAQLAGRRR